MESVIAKTLLVPFNVDIMSSLISKNVHDYEDAIKNYVYMISDIGFEL